MKKHLNTLFVALEGAYLRKDSAAIEIRHEGESKLRVPLRNLDGIAYFGWDISCSAALMAACVEANVSLSFQNPYGKFLALGARRPLRGGRGLKPRLLRSHDEVC